MSPLETICMECQILFSGKNKKNITNLSSAEIAQRELKVKSDTCKYAFGASAHFAQSLRRSFTESLDIIRLYNLAGWSGSLLLVYAPKIPFLMARPIITLSALGKIFSDILKYCSYFSQEQIRYDVSCKLSPICRLLDLSSEKRWHTLYCNELSRKRWRFRFDSMAA